MIWGKGVKAGRWTFVTYDERRYEEQMNRGRLQMDVFALYFPRALEGLVPEMSTWFAIVPQGPANVPWSGLSQRAQLPLLAYPERRYGGLWHENPTFRSTEVHGLDPQAHAARCLTLAIQGYQPKAIAVVEMVPGKPLVTASVWHRPGDKSP
jgi:hypothetical protein